LRRAAKKDDNHVEIVAAFRAIGAFVFDVAQLKNACDIIIVYHGRTLAVEIKDGSKVASKRRMTPGEAEFKQSWELAGGEHKIIETVEDVMSWRLTP
jgi:hypothetical protein